MNQLPLNKNELPLIREMLTKYKQGYISGLIPGSNITFSPSGCRNKIISSTSSGTGGGIESIVAGDNITVDNTDPLNPIVSASSSLFPNGVEIVTSSRDFQSSDIGKILVVTTSNVHLTMPLGTTFGIGTIFGLKFLGNLTDCDFESTNGAVIEPLITVEDGEFITFSTGFSGSNSSVGPISGQYILDNGIWKTDLKYLYDKVNANNYFGTATLASGTVTVSNANVKTGDIIFVTINTPSGTLGFLSASTADIVDATSFVINSSSALDNSTVNWWIKTP